jgi:hypothetical protein
MPERQIVVPPSQDKDGAAVRLWFQIEKTRNCFPRPVERHDKPCPPALVCALLDHGFRGLRDKIRVGLILRQHYCEYIKKGASKLMWGRKIRTGKVATLIASPSSVTLILTLRSSSTEVVMDGVKAIIVEH